MGLAARTIFIFFVNCKHYKRGQTLFSVLHMRLPLFCQKEETCSKYLKLVWTYSQCCIFSDFWSKNWFRCPGKCKRIFCL